MSLTEDDHYTPRSGWATVRSRLCLGMTPSGTHLSRHMLLFVLGPSGGTYGEGWHLDVRSDGVCLYPFFLPADFPVVSVTYYPDSRLGDLADLRVGSGVYSVSQRGDPVVYRIRVDQVELVSELDAGTQFCTIGVGSILSRDPVHVALATWHLIVTRSGQDTVTNNSGH